jgi:ABC-type transporter Mla subunit MlaD
VSNPEICFAELLNGDTALQWIDPPCVDPIFGIAAPLFLWSGCLFIVLLSLFLSFRLLTKSAPVVKTLNRLTKQINSIEPKDRALDGVGLEELREIMVKSPFVSDAWGEFEETLLIHTEGNSQQVFNTRQADEYFSQEAILGGRINMRLYSAFPGILTSIGLLLTFIAILLGLSHIHPDPTAQGKLTGVEELVYSLSGKFISSICALGLAVLFTFFEKRREILLSRSIHGFIKALNKRFARKPAEHILQLIQKDISEQSIAFRQFGADLSGHLKESFSEGMGPHFQKVAEAVEELKKHKSESLTDSLGSIISEFKSALMGSTNSEFKTLESTLNKTADLMSSMNEQSKLSQEKMAEVIQSLDAAVSKQSSSGDEHLSRLADTMQIIIEKLEAAATQSSGSMTSSVTQLLEQLQSSFSSQASEMSRRNDEMSGLMKGMLEQVQTSLNQSSSSVSTTVNGVLEKSSEWTEKTTAQLGAVLEEQTRNARAVNDARDSLNSALEIFRKAVNEGSSTLNEMGTASTSVKEGVTTLTGAVSNLGRTQDKVSDLASLVEKNAESLKSVIDRQSDIVTKYESVVRDLDKTLSTVLTQVTSSIENYSARVKSSLETTLGQFDNHLGNATAKLGGTVQDLSESLEDLVELASKSNGNGV